MTTTTLLGSLKIKPTKMSKANNVKREELRLSLARSLGAWLDSQEDGLEMWIGEDLSAHMANAAFAVMEGIRDAQDYLEENGLIE